MYLCNISISLSMVCRIDSELIRQKEIKRLFEKSKVQDFRALASYIWA